MVAEDARRRCGRCRRSPTSSSDLLANAPQLKVTINRDQASRFGISPQLIDDTLNDAFGQRQITQYFTQLNTYSIILEILPELQDDSRLARPHLREVAADRRRRAAVGAGRRRYQQGRAALGRRIRASSRRSRCRSICAPASRSARRSTPSTRRRARSACRPRSSAPSRATRRRSRPRCRASRR